MTKKIFIIFMLWPLPELAVAQLSSVVDRTTVAVATVQGGQIDSSESNPANTLYGRLSGLYVMQGETLPWANDPKLFVRGLATLNNAAPLVLVDGYERPLNSLTIEEIENVSVLKDAAALAIYGMRGANGVVLVTTKRGIGQGVEVKVSYQFGIDTPVRMPEMADSYNYAMAMNEALIFDGLNKRYSDADIADFRSGTNPELFPNVDWRKKTIRDAGFSHRLTASFRGGMKAVRYYSQISYNGSNGLIRPHDMASEYSSQMEWDRLSVRTNLDVDVTRTTRFAISLLGQIEQHHRPSTSPAEIFQNIYNTPAGVFPVKTESGLWGADDLRRNPIAALVAPGYTDGNDRALYADMRLTQDLSSWAEGLSAEAAVGFDNRASYWEGQGRGYASEVVNYDRDNAGVISDVKRTTIGADTPLSYSSEIGAASVVFTADAIVRYNRTLNDIHDLAGTFGYHMESNAGEGMNNTFRRQSLIANLGYDYDDRYLLNATVSYAGSSVMRDGDRFRFFPAVSAAWVLSNEGFLNSSSSIDLLKLRASWGVTGSDKGFIYGLSKQMFGGRSSYYFGANNSGASGNGEGLLANAHLTSEIAYKADFGVDARLFKGLDITADVFYEDRRNILVPTVNIYSGVLGVGTAIMNQGQVRNQGFEVGITWNRTHDEWSYVLGGTFTFSRNEIVNMNEGYVPYDYLRHTGNRMGQYYGLRAEGFFRDQQDIDDSVPHTFSQVRPGDVKYKDMNDDGHIDAYDRVATGYSTALPEIYYGLTAGVTWKGVSLRADFQGVANYSLYMDMASVYRPLRGNTNVSNHYLANRWTASNMDGAKYPRLTTLDNNNNLQPNSIWHENGSFLKLRNVELRWVLPSDWAHGIGSSQICMFARGTNLFSLDHVKLLDPELMYATYPSLRSYNIGVNLTF